MGNAMTFATFCVFFMDCGAMRLTVAFLADRQLPVNRMAFCAGKRTMLCLTRLQQLERLLMTTGTDFFSLGNGIGYYQRGVRVGMTAQAIRSFKYYHGTVVLMAFSTLRDAPVFF